MPHNTFVVLASSSLALMQLTFHARLNGTERIYKMNIMDKAQDDGIFGDAALLAAMEEYEVGQWVSYKGDISIPGLYTVTVYDKGSMVIGTARNVLAWTRREAYFSVMNNMPKHETWGSCRDVSLKEWPEVEPKPIYCREGL